MKDTWQTFGHEAIKQVLQAQLEAGELPHAYLFEGFSGVGKRTLADELAAKALNARRLSNHPDYLLLEPKDGVILVEEALRFSEQLAYKPFVAARKVAVVDGADLLNAHSANALLKTVEEPAARTTVILIAGPRGVLPTLTSRCQRFWFNRFTEGQLRAFAEARGVAATDELITLSFGSPGRLVGFLSDTAVLERAREDAQSFRTFFSAPLAGRLTLVGQLSDREPEDLSRLLSCWLNLARRNLSSDPSRTGTVEAISAALGALGTNRNKKFIFQNLALTA